MKTKYVQTKSNMRMKSILRIACTMSAIMLISTGLFAQENLLISGGNTVASYVCSNSRIAVWGKNDDGQLGLGSAAGALVTSPMLMAADAFGTSTGIRQVNSGSGGHFVALTCSSTGDKTQVWSWGGNDRGQVGNGSQGGTQTTPARVRASSVIDAAYTETDGSIKYLVNAEVVFAGNSVSYAILENGDLASWGGNGSLHSANEYTHTYGQLGDGTQTDRYEAVYVLTGAGQRLKNIVSVCAGDNATYALDASGQVWSWGWSQSAAIDGSNPGNGQLGRPEGQSNYAKKINYAGLDGSGYGPMNNIKYISCSDGVGYAIDEDNYVWAWGNGGWNNQLGSPTGNPHASGWQPRKVRDVVPVSGSGNANAFLKAKQVAGGQGFGMAVTMDGKPVVWGGGGCLDGGGGTSIPGGNGDGYPRYITRPSGDTDSVVLINRADHGGWYITASGKVYAFGCNNNKDAGITGILGTGKSDGGYLTNPTEITLPSGCDRRDPLPEVAISPKALEVCKTEFNGIKVNSGFALKGTVASNYNILWEYQAPGETTWVAIKTPGKGKGNVSSYKTLTEEETREKGEGLYRVTVEYTGTTSCMPYPDAVDTLEIKFFTQDFKDPGTLKVTDCGTKTAEVSVAPKSPATAADISKRVYEWYRNEVGGTALATTIGTGTATIADVSTALDDCSAQESNPAVTCNPAFTDEQKIVWVEEVSGAEGLIIPKSLRTETQWLGGNQENLKNGLSDNRHFTGLEVKEKITLTELSFMLQTSVDVPDKPYTTPCPDPTQLYGCNWPTPRGGKTTLTVGVYKADGAKPAATPIATLGTVTYERTRLTESEPETVRTQHTVNGEVVLQPGIYFIAISNSTFEVLPGTATNNGGFKEIKIGKEVGSSQTINDNLSPNVVTHPSNMTATAGNGGQSGIGMFYDIKFRTSQKFCDRIPMYINVDCPTCTKPGVDVEITATPPATNGGKVTTNATMDIVELCAGQSINLGANSIKNGTYDKYNMYWFKEVNTANVSKAVVDGTTLPTALKTALEAATIADLSVTYNEVTEAGTKYYLFAYDKADPAKLCHTWDSIIVHANPTPTASLNTVADVCEGTAMSAVTVTFADGKAPYSFKYSDSEITGEQSGTTAGTATTADLTPSTLPTAAKTYTYTLASFEDANGCAGVVTPPVDFTRTITINPTPTATISASKLSYCEENRTASGVMLSLTPATGINLTGATYKWSNGTTSATISNAVADKYTCEITLNGCTYTTAEVEIVEHATPTYTITGDGEYCPTETTRTPVVVTFTGKAPITFDIANKTEFTANATGLIYTSTTATGSNTPGTEYKPINITDGNGCKAAASAASVTVINKTVEGLEANNATLCLNTATTYDISTLITKPTLPAEKAKIVYSLKAGSKGSITGSSLSLTESSATTYTVIATLPAVEGATCPSEIEITVETLPLPAPTIVTQDVCFGTASPLSVTAGTSDAAYDSYAWTISGSGALSSPTAAAPSITNTTVAGNYTVSLVVTDANNCKNASVSAPVTIHEIPVVTLSATKQEFCVGDEDETITATPTITGGTGEWCDNATEHENTTAKFKPASASEKTTITYNYTSSAANGSCKATPVTIDMVVNANPTFTIAPSVASACEVDVLNANVAVTMSTTPVLSGGTFVYSGAVDIDAGTGAFNSEDQSGTKTITLDYEDANGCKGTANTTFTINSLPEVKFGTNPTEICSDAGDLTLDVSPAPGSGSAFSFTGTSASSSAVFPAKAAGGTQAFTYNYTDANGCKGEASYSLESILVATPATVSKTVQISSSGSFNLGENTDLTATLATGADAIEWFDAGDCGGSVLTTGLTHATGVIATMGEGTHNYLIRSKQAIAGGTCYSPCAAAVLNVTACPALTPDAKNAHFCFGEPTPSPSLKVIPATATDIAWFDKNPVGLNGAASTAFPQNGVNLLGVGAVYPAPITTKGKQTVWVASYDAGKDCWSVGREVTLEIHEKPEPTVTASKPDFCAADEVVEFTLTPAIDALPAGTTYTFEQTTTSYGGFDAATRTWNAMADAWTVDVDDPSTAERTIEVTYKVIENHGVAGEIPATCIDSTEVRPTAHFMVAPPAVADKYWLINDIAGISTNFMEGTLSSTGDKMSWYDSDKTLALETGSLTHDPKRTQLQSEVTAAGSIDEHTKTYYITQRNVRGCESEQTEVRLLLVNCPFQAPIVTSNAECAKELPTAGMELKAEKAALQANGTTTPTPIAWHWYASETATAVISDAPTASADNSSYFSKAQTSTDYWVSYSAVETSSGQACESKRSKVSLTVHADPVITALTPSKAVYCNTDDASTSIITATVAWNDSQAASNAYKWSITGETSGISGSDAYANFAPSTWGETTADYEVVYEVENNNGCKDTMKLTVPVQFSPVPTIKDGGYYAAPDASATVTITAEDLETVANGFEKVNWYQTNTSTTPVSVSNPWNTGHDPAKKIAYDSPETRYATQVIRGCESERSEAKIIIDCPVPAPKVADRIICNYFADPEIEIEAGDWLYGTRPSDAPVYTFYSTETGNTTVGTPVTGGADGTATWQSLIASRPTNGNGEVKFWVSEFNDGADPVACEGPRSAVTIYIRDAADITIAPITAICEYDATPAVTASNLSSSLNPTVEWYYAEPARVEGNESASDETGNPFTPKYKGSVDGDGDYDIWATQRIAFNGFGTSSDDISCVSKAAKATLVIKAQPGKPTLTPNENCFGNVNTTLKAVGSNIQWYKNGTSIQTGISFTPADRNAGTYTYQATQTVNGCESEKEDVTFRIKEIPAKPTLAITKDKVCDYEGEPTINATLEELSTAIDKTASIDWYSAALSSAKLGQAAFVNQLEIVADRSITQQYFATQTVEGCTSAFANIHYNVIPVVPAPTTVNAVSCENETNIPYLRANSSKAKWYTQDVALPNLPSETPLAVGNTYKPFQQAGDVPATTTYYVQDESQGCFSNMTPVTITIIPTPEMTIGNNVNFCIYANTVVAAENLVPAMASGSRIDWRLTVDNSPFNRPLGTETDGSNYYVTLDNTKLPTPGDYNLTAIYHVINGSKTCSSAPQTITVTMNDRPNPPIVASKIICQGTALEPLQAFGSPNINWTFIDGPMPLTDWFGETYDFNRIGYDAISVGEYSFELFDTDATTGCESLPVTLHFEVAPAAETKIIGKTELCASTSLEEPYSIEVVPTESSMYKWNTSGDTYNYSKDGNPYSPSRYIDWHKQGIDTVYVKETTWAGCEGFDTLVVSIAPYPVAYYTWSLPGATTTIEFLDSSYQAPITSRYDESVEPIQLEYTMAWNFDRVPSTDPNHVDLEVPYNERNIPITVDNYTYGYKYPVLTVTNEYGCSAKYTTEIFVDIRAGVYIPNAFSPLNAAASVRVFKPIAFNLEWGKFWVYDAWGNLLFYSDEVKDGMFVGEWNGTYGGELMQNGVYMWKMEAKFLDGTTWPGQKKQNGAYTKFGNVTLIR